MRRTQFMTHGVENVMRIYIPVTSNSAEAVDGKLRQALPRPSQNTMRKSWKAQGWIGSSDLGRG